MGAGLMFVEDLCPQGGLEYEDAKRVAAVIEAARAAPYEIESILESLAFSPPENLPLHYARLVELANHLHAAVEALEAKKEPTP